MNFDNLCMNCFEKLTQGSVCANCGFDNDSVSDMLFLPRKTLLSGRYLVGNSLSKESDAVTYIGLDTETGSTVTIREFMPAGIANRLEGNLNAHVREKYKKTFDGCKKSFIKLWNTLKGMNSLSAVIPVLDVFEENETAYAISEKMATVSLRDFLIRNSDNIIPWDKARLMFMPVLTTLEKLHENGIIHGCINPDNLVLCKDGKVRLAGFCISECNMAGTELEFNENEGYTALEQYNKNHKVCPATDIYAFSACIYRALVGTNPPGALARETNDKLMIPNVIAEKIPAYVIKALGAGLQIYPERRIQSVYDYRELLNAAPSVVAKAAEIQATEQRSNLPEEKKHESPAKAEKAKKKGNKGKLIAIILAVVAVVAAAVYVFGFSGLINSKETTVPQTTAAPVTVPDFSTQGYTESDIKNGAAWNQQFKISFNYAYNPECEAGIVYEQSIKAGETVPQGSAIVLTVSKGTEMATVPDVGSLTSEEAQKQLEALGFKVKTIPVYNNGSYTPNTVKKTGGTAPAAGESVEKGTTVIIQVYGEEETTTAPPAQTEPAVTQ